MLDRVEATLRKHDMVRPGECLLVAVSGGADSVALLGLLKELSARFPFELVAAHFEHGIRGEASREDARFVAKLCEALNIPLHMGAGDVPAQAAVWKTGLEDAARRARYTFLKEAMVQCGARTVALAHHAEDQAETLLLHLTRGSGLTGLCGMRPVQGLWVRPLLFEHREDLRAYLMMSRLPWREDATNAVPDRPRTQVRHMILPALARINPAAVEAMVRAMSLLQRDEDYLHAQAAEALGGVFFKTLYGGYMETGGVQALDAALQSRMVRMAATSVGTPPLTEEQTEALLALMHRTSGMENLPRGIRAQRTHKRLHFLRPDGEAPAPGAVSLPGAGKAVLPGIGTLCITDTADGLGDGIRTQAFDADALRGCELRLRRAGDRIHPLGAPGAMKLSDYWINRYIDRPFRPYLPVLAKGERVLWSIGVGVAADAAVTENTRAVTRLAWQSPLPWEGEAMGDGGNDDEP